MTGTEFDGQAQTAGWTPAAACRRAAAGLLALFAASWLIAGAPARAEERIAVAGAALEAERGADPGVFLNAQFEFTLPPALADAVTRGVAVYFVVDFELSRHRWYWVDQRLAEESLGYRLSYSPLTRQYRLARGALAQPFDTLDEALATIRRVGHWKVLDADVLRPDQRYDARVRLRLDTSLLPKPFQVNALTNRDWSLTSEWFAVPVTDDLAR
ncbi:MAG TPA: DUF4390 domain-containing protein [Burkholderiaceae bacterium]|nr:DUF4390 domain-containing protein [Burkholderiaceae bacterium]